MKIRMLKTVGKYKADHDYDLPEVEAREILKSGKAFNNEPFDDFLPEFMRPRTLPRITNPQTFKDIGEAL